MNTKLEIITCSVNYSDFLSITLPRNKKLVDNVIVVTSMDDKNTEDICEENHVTYIKTNVFYLDGAVFNRGAALNQAKDLLLFNDWVLFLDADIVLPENFLRLLDLENLNPYKFYGVGRYYIETIEDLELYNNEQKQLKDFELNECLWGYGYFQLFNVKFFEKQEIEFVYPGSLTKNDTDLLFRIYWGLYKNWDNEKKDFVWHPEYQEKLNFNVIHLGQKIRNWDGRIAKNFLEKKI